MAIEESIHANRRITGPISQRATALRPSGIRKFFDLLSGMEGVISLGVGEPDYSTPWRIREAAIYSLEQGKTMYTSNLGTPELRERLAQYLMDMYGLSYDPAGELLITVGVSEALDLAMRATIDPSDEVVIPTPCYVAYDASVLLSGGKPMLVPTIEENGFEVDPADVEAAITPRTKAILIGYPANPTGAVMPHHKLEALAAVARRHNLLVMSDEIYARLVYGEAHTCFASLPGMQERTVLLGGFSKAWAMTGWRIGYAAGPKEVIAAMTKIHQYTIMCAPTMAQVAALEALKGGEESVAEMVEDYNHRRLLIVKGLRDIGLSTFEPRGAFYAFPSIKSTGLSSEDFAEKLLKDEKVAVVPGTAFGACGEGYVRCCYATALPELEEALTRIKRFVAKQRGGRVLNKIINFLRYLWAVVFLGGAVLNLVLTITNPQGYAGAVLFAWPPALQTFWDSTVAQNMRLFLFIFIAIEVALGLLLINKGRWVKYGAMGALIFGAGLLLLGPGALAGQEVVARVPNLVFELMMLSLLWGRYDMTLVETVRRRRMPPVQTKVIGG